MFLFVVNDKASYPTFYLNLQIKKLINLENPNYFKKQSTEG